ncbi:MAG: hypothetical protein ACOVQ0_16460 [Novosphingobium sp.]
MSALITLLVATGCFSFGTVVGALWAWHNDGTDPDYDPANWGDHQ